MGKKVKIPGRLESAETGGIVTGANEIIDDTRGKTQYVVNNELEAAILQLGESKQNKLTFDQTPTEDSPNPVTSGGVYAADQVLSQAIEAILLMIPSAASALNKLVDMATMNSSIATATASFKGTYNLVSDLHLTVDATHAQIAAALDALSLDADNNDYAFVQVPNTDTAPTEIAKTERYKFNGENWAYEYDLNNSGFTAAQWAAINSGITTLLVSKLSALPTSADLASAFAGKQDVLTFDNVPTAGSPNPVKSGGVYMRNNEIVALINALDAAKQNVLTFDTTPTSGSPNPVTSNGIYLAIQLVQTAVVALDGRMSTTETKISTAETNIVNLQAAYSALTQSDIVVVEGALPSSGQQQNVIYRQPDPDHTPPQFYSDYMWNGTAWVLMATYNNAIDDVPTANSNNLVKSGGVAKLPFLAYFRRLRVMIESQKVTFTPTGTGSYLEILGHGNTNWVGVAIAEETSYTLTGSQVLVIDNNTITVKNSPLKTDIILFGRDAYAGICYGVLIDSWQNQKIDDNKAEIDDINGQIGDAEYAFSDPVNVSFADSINGKYLDKDTAAVVDYNGYSISAPILLHAGDILKGTVSASDVCVLAETNQSGSSYSKIISVNSVGTYNMKYEADADIYVAVCYRTTTVGTGTVLTIGNEESTFEDISAQVVKNKKDIEPIEVPDFVMEQTKQTFKRFLSWKGSDDCLVFPIITDLHTKVNDDKDKVVKYLIATDKLFGYSFIANLGDVGIATSTASENDAYAILDKVAVRFGQYKQKVLFCVGNHDIDQLEGMGIDQSVIMNYFAQPTFNRYSEDFVKDNVHQCYYIDYHSLKIRVICVNTSDKNSSSGYDMSREQFFWIYDTLINTPANYKVLVLGHFCICKIGEWKNYISDSNYAFGSTFYLQKFYDMLKAFANRTTVTVGSQTLDFSNIDSSIKMIGYLCGDSHFDAQIGRNENVTVKKMDGGVETDLTINGDGVNVVITQSYGTIPNPSDEVPAWATYTSFDINQNVLIDVVGIKPNTGNMAFFRIGAGGVGCDREFTF